MFRKQQYSNDLLNLAKEYLTSVSQFCLKGIHHWGMLDRANMHNLLELYTHALHLFRPALYCQILL